MTNEISPATSRAAFAIGAEQVARRTVDFLSESLKDGEAAIAAFERPDGCWNVAVHFADPPDEERIRALVALVAGDEVAQAIAFDSIAARDWVEASLEGLAPVPAGRFVVHGRHDRARVPPNKLGIEIEAALAFGTGHHGTTRGCLLLLDQVLRGKMPRRILDLGAGTGVLAIAAAKASRRNVLASDIDPRSAAVARENAASNGVGNLVQSIRATGFSAPPFRTRAPFDLVLANILANPLRQMAPAMARHLAPEAMVILSGLLPQQTRGVIAAYRAQGLVLIRQIRIDGWCSLLMQNRG
ncbi:50S ribosomal protein L11 methyltransferase [Nitrobacter sp.]|uniref:50S ribosomal protein L11 methyltransferase n=1 Tax=Nitrobacter sp. TaxID=29420 RepID=UPI001D1C9E32|nr:50S ribosomal protein L11 methyltransferase [Nitrobacter sp.]MCB1393823.1 50S ribosomal protein L11 methyltransferase [Nitrobacter sp.]